MILRQHFFAPYFFIFRIERRMHRHDRVERYERKNATMNKIGTYLFFANFITLKNTFYKKE